MTLELVIILCVVAAIAYWRGLIAGTNHNIREKIQEILKDLPVNVTITSENGEFFAYFFHNKEFLSQSNSYDSLIEKLSDKFPGKHIVVAVEE